MCARKCPTWPFSRNRSLPGINGIEATRNTVRDSPHIGAVVAAMFEDDDSLFVATRSGALGYALKSGIFKVIRAVAGGEAHFGPENAVRLMRLFSTLRPSALSEAFPGLTARERNNSSNTEIADHLYLSPKTARNYASNILHKLQVADRAQAITHVLEAGMGRDGR